MKRMILTMFALAAFALASSASAAVFYMTPAGGGDGSSWASSFGPNDFDTLVTAWDDGDELWMAGGAYTPTEEGYHESSPPRSNHASDADIEESTVCYINKAVSVYGGFAGTESALSERDLSLGNETVINGWASNRWDPGTGVTPAPATHIIKVDGVVGAVVIDGLTLTGGAAVPAPPSWSKKAYRGDHNGGGIYVPKENWVPAPVNGNNLDLDLFVRNCKIVGCHSANRGGAVHVDDCGFYMDNCVIGGNTSDVIGDGPNNMTGGIYMWLPGDYSITNSTFLRNISPEGGTALHNDNRPGGVVANNVFAYNLSLAEDIAAGSGNSNAAVTTTNAMTLLNNMFFCNWSRTVINPPTPAAGMDFAIPAVDPGELTTLYDLDWIASGAAEINQVVEGVVGADDALPDGWVDPSNNIDTGLDMVAGPEAAATGAWESISAAYDENTGICVLEDSDMAWTPGELVGKIIDVNYDPLTYDPNTYTATGTSTLLKSESSKRNQLAVIIGNTATTVTVAGPYEPTGNAYMDPLFKRVGFPVPMATDYSNNNYLIMDVSLASTSDAIDAGLAGLPPIVESNVEEIIFGLGARAQYATGDDLTLTGGTVTLANSGTDIVDAPAPVDGDASSTAQYDIGAYEYQPGGSPATGDTALAYQWKKDDVILTGETNATLDLTNIQEDDAGVYTLIATSLGQSVTAAEITLTFNPFTAVDLNWRQY